MCFGATHYATSKTLLNQPMNSQAGNETNLVREIEIAGSAQRVFAAISKPEHMLKWWSSEGQYQASEAESDPRPGGHWKLRVLMQSGATLTIHGVYLQVEHPHLLSYTWNRDDRPEDGESFVRWDLKEHASTTQVRLTHSGLKTEAARAIHGGWTTILEILRKHILAQE